MNEPFSEDAWNEDEGAVLWWCWCDGQWLAEPPYIGSPLDLGQSVLIRTFGKEDRYFGVGGWPGYHTHWTRTAVPSAPTE